MLVQLEPAERPHYVCYMMPAAHEEVKRLRAERAETVTPDTDTLARAHIVHCTWPVHSSLHLPILPVSLFSSSAQTLGFAEKSTHDLHMTIGHRSIMCKTTQNRSIVTLEM